MMKQKQVKANWGQKQPGVPWPNHSHSAHRESQKESQPNSTYESFGLNRIEQVANPFPTLNTWNVN